MIIVKGEARFASGEIDRLREALNDWIKEACRRPGCLSYSYAVDLADPNLVQIVETWQDQAAFDAHMAEPGPLMTILAGARLLALRADAYDASYITTLFNE